MYHALATRRNKEKSDYGKMRRRETKEAGERISSAHFLPFQDDDGIGGGGETASIANYADERSSERDRGRVHYNEETTRCSTDESVG